MRMLTKAGLQAGADKVRLSHPIGWALLMGTAAQAGELRTVVLCHMADLLCGIEGLLPWPVHHL